MQKLDKGEQNRHYAETLMNHTSSRSHTIFRLFVKAVTNNFIRNYRKEMRDSSNINNENLLKELNDSDENCIQTGTLVTEALLNFVDLAGSEKVSNHHLLSDDMYLFL